MSLGNKILTIRKKRELSQEELGEMIGVTRQTISNWELGETSPNPEQLKLLSNVLKISIDDLLDNNIQNIISEKLVNTERLTEIAIRSVKFLGILFIILLIVDIISFVLLMILK